MPTPIHIEFRKSEATSELITGFTQNITIEAYKLVGNVWAITPVYDGPMSTTGILDVDWPDDWLFNNFFLFAKLTGWSDESLPRWVSPEWPFSFGAGPVIEDMTVLVILPLRVEGPKKFVGALTPADARSVVRVINEATGELLTAVVDEDGEWEVELPYRNGQDRYFVQAEGPTCFSNATIGSVDPVSPAPVTTDFHANANITKGDATVVVELDHEPGEMMQVSLWDIDYNPVSSVVTVLPNESRVVKLGVAEDVTDVAVEVDYLGPKSEFYGGYIPHLDYADPDNFDVEAARFLHLKSGENDFGLLTYAVYPALSPEVYPLKTQKLRHVGFTTKGAALLTSPPTFKYAGEWSGWGYWYAPPVHLEAGEMPDTGFTYWLIPVGTKLDAEHMSNAGSEGYSLVYFDFDSYPEGDYHVITDNPIGEPPSAFPSWAGTDIRLLFRDLLLAGFSPRQARTMQRVKAMSPESARLKALITGGFNRPQAKLLLELLES